MSYDAWKTTEPDPVRWVGMEGSPEFQERQDEDAREQRWTEFIAWTKTTSPSVLLRSVAELMEDRRDPSHIIASIRMRLDDFAETEQWSGVLAALSRSLREQGR